MGRPLTSYRSNSKAPTTRQGRVRRALGLELADQHVRIRRGINVTEFQIGMTGLKHGTGIAAHQQQRDLLEELRHLDHRVSDARRRHQHRGDHRRQHRKGVKHA